MGPVVVLVLISVLLQFGVNFPAVAGDCYDDPLDNNRSYNNCDSCFETLVNALINTADNKYQLGRTFFPSDDVIPVQVRVTYKPINGTRTADNNCTTDLENLGTIWYWLMGDFYAYQPVDVFHYRSLLFAPPSWHKQSVELFLPSEEMSVEKVKAEIEVFEERFNTMKMLTIKCLEKIQVSVMAVVYILSSLHAVYMGEHKMFLKKNVQKLSQCQNHWMLFASLNLYWNYLSYHLFCNSGNYYDFFEYLTQRLKIHASYQTTTALVTKTHVGKAINAKYDDDDKESIIQAVYYVPFLVTLIILLFLIFCVCVFEHLNENTTKKPNDSKPTFSDIWNLLLSNYKRKIKKLKSQFYHDLQTQSSLVAITLLCCLFPIYTFVLDMCSVEREENADLPDYFKEGYYGLYAITISFSIISLLFDLIGIIGFIIVRWYNLCKKQEKWDYFVPMLICIGSTFLSLSFHFQNILIAWFTDPFYAGRIALFYGFVAICYFISLKYVHLLPCKILGNEDHKIDPSDRPRFLISILLFITIVVCTGTIVAVTLLLVEIANNNSVEQSITGITTIYNGAVILIGVLIAYSLSVRYFEYPFSLENALKKAMEEMNAPLNFNPDINRVWEKLTEERRMTEVMKALIQEQLFSRFCSLRSTLTSVLIKAHRDHHGTLINASPDQIVTISTVLHDAMINAVRDFAEEKNVNISTVTDALVKVMNEPKFLLRDNYIDLSKTPTGGMLTMLQKDLTNNMDIQDETVSVNPDELRMCLTIALIPLPSILANILRNSELIRDFQEDVQPKYNAINSAVRTAAGNDISNIYYLTGFLVRVIEHPQFVPTNQYRTTEESLVTLSESLKEVLGSEKIKNFTAEQNVKANIKSALENFLQRRA